MLSWQKLQRTEWLDHDRLNGNTPVRQNNWVYNPHAEHKYKKSNYGSIHISIQLIIMVYLILKQVKKNPGQKSQENDLRGSSK